jgi:GrpB-like predicted nucleotidyltransferase (UPF0157 family)
MLQPDEQQYLDNLPENQSQKIVKIYPYNSEIATIADSVIKKLHDKLPDTNIAFIGASALQISGQNDIDIYILEPQSKHENDLVLLNSLLGQQENNHWSWSEHGYEVSVYLADPNTPTLKKQIDVFNKLKNNPELLKEYEKLKLDMDGKTYKEYQTAKYQFYNKILSNN